MLCTHKKVYILSNLQILQIAFFTVCTTFSITTWVKFYHFVFHSTVLFVLVLCVFGSAGLAIDERLIFSPTWISFWYRQSGNVLALAMVVFWCTLLCHTKNPCTLSDYSHIIKISSWVVLIARSSEMDGTSKRPCVLSGTGYHDPQLM